MLDFAILSAPRSGTHMLASALNSHPDIDCFLELFGARDAGSVSWKGKVIGGIMSPFLPLPVDKIIHMVRPMEECAKSALVSRAHHSEHKEVVVCLKTAATYPKYVKTVDYWQEKSAALVADYDHITVTYDELCGSEDAAVLMNTDRICDFIGVDCLPLTPAYRKPIYTGDGRQRGIMKEFYPKLAF